MLLAESPGTREVRPTVVTLFLTATLLASVVSTGESLDVGFRRRLDKRQGKICIGTNGRMSVPNNREHHYRNLRDRYTNCTYVDGNLELTWLQDEKLDLSFLRNIREVTGYVLISHVDVPRIELPSLQIIRGRTLFKLSVQDDEFALIVTLSKMHNLEMPALRDILQGSVGIMNNYNLCHIKTIKWKEIITDRSAKYLYVYKFKEPERDCAPCHESCEKGCWGPGPENCQQFSKINCSPQCGGGRCFGPRPRECCHQYCAGGCTGPTQKDCLACTNFYDDGVCKQECPPMQRYNQVKYRWERNPDGKYAYGATCVKDCPKHLLKDNGACVRACPPEKKSVNGECVPCKGPCPKICHFSDTIHAGNIDKLENCTVIEGSVSILDNSFEGFQEVHENFTFGDRHPPMHPDRLEALSSLKEITGFLNVQGVHPDFKDLSAFRNLEIIGGRATHEYFSSLYIVKTSLTSLGLRSLRKIRSGAVAILENAGLCYASEIGWRKIMQSPNHSTLLQNNKDPQKCIREGEVCSSQCSPDGCWGKGSDLCLECLHFHIRGESGCVEKCDSSLGLFHDIAGSGECIRCDPECDRTCHGAGPGKCDRCKHSRDGPFCVAECPIFKYREEISRECRQCHDNCVDGCTGPRNTLGDGGCRKCHKAIIDADSQVVRCLAENEECPEGYYESVPSTYAARALCRPCHPLCKRCNGYGFHRDVCQECVGLEQNEQCTVDCSSDYYADKDSRTCKPCAEECRGCSGPGVARCKTCKNYKIFPDGGDVHDNETAFECTQTCPASFPHKIFTDQGEDPYCSATPLHVGPPLASTQNISAILGGVSGCIVIFGVFILLFCWQWQKRAKAKENTAKMAMVMTGYEDSEPLRPTNIKPNLAKLKIIKESELGKGGILGCGAFGTVHRGVWIPEGENVKIPVAIKVLNEGTSANANKEILEEAYIMASLEHPNLLQLLAICIKSQMMLVTQLMPLGCLLDYVKNNKNKIGSKPLLNWSLQIARGMAYLESRRLVHRDLAARNVLVQSPERVKITDFGLARLLDINEDEYKAEGGRMPIKWLALECIRQRVFTHKSDVWAFGVTVWELITYGSKPYREFGRRPYDEHDIRELPDKLAVGERLKQPENCTLELYHILIKCWLVEPENRPSFADLEKEFAKMAQDPGRYLVIEGDSLMRLPSYTTQDERVLVTHLSSHLGGSKMVVHAEEYLNPGGVGRATSSHTLNTPVDTPLQPETPTQKFFPPSMQLPPSYQDTFRAAAVAAAATTSRRGSRYGSHVAVSEGFNTLGSKSLRSHHGGTTTGNFLSASCDPLKSLEDDHVSSMPSGNTMLSQKSLGPPPPGKNAVTGAVMASGSNTATTTTRSSAGSGGTSSSGGRRRVNVAGLRLDLPVDDEDYLVPSPQSPPNLLQPGSGQPNPLGNNNNIGSGSTAPYMDLLSADPVTSTAKGSHQQPQQTMFPYPPPQGYFLTDYPSNYGRVPDFTHLSSHGLISMDNPEYILNEQRGSHRGNYHTLGIPLVHNSGSPSSGSTGGSSGGGANGPSSIQSAPGFSGMFHHSTPAQNSTVFSPGLNGALKSGGPAAPRTPGATSQQTTATRSRSSAGESESDEHEYYNDLDRIRRELQPLQPNRTISVSSQQQLAGQQPQPASKHETTV